MLDLYITASIQAPADIAGTVIYSLFRMCVARPDEAINPALTRKTDDAPGMTDEGFRQSQIFHDARMFDPEVEYVTAVAPRDFKNLFTEKSIA